MQTLFHRAVSQPLISFFAVGLATITLAFAWSQPGAGTAVSGESLLSAGSLILALFVAGQFPIHARNNVKLMVLTVPLYLIAVLLDPPLAAVTAGLAMLIYALEARPRMGLLPADIATLVGRWIVTVYLASLVAQLGESYPEWQIPMLLAAAGVMFLCDVVGVGFEVAPMTGETPFQVMRFAMRDLAVAEGVQYLIGVLGALVALASVPALVLLVVPIGVVYVTFKRMTEMQQGTRLLLEQLADAIELRDPYTGGHSRRVTEICRQILNELDVSGVEADLILVSARVHDIGKISVPDELLLKPGALTPQERLVVESHVTVGASLLQGHDNFRRGVSIVRHHHERWDGNGYPDQLKGMEIPLGARVVAVADSFEAMTSDRPYRRAFSVEQALTILKQGRGTQWDPRIVNAMLSIHGTADESRRERAEQLMPVKG